MSAGGPPRYSMNSPEHADPNHNIPIVVDITLIGLHRRTHNEGDIGTRRSYTLEPALRVGSDLTSIHDDAPEVMRVQTRILEGRASNLFERIPTSGAKGLI